MTFYMSATFHEATFIQGVRYGSIGLVKGSTYQIEVRQLLFGRIQVQAVHGYENKPIDGTKTIYKDLFNFFKDWQPNQIAPVPGHSGGIS